MSQNLKALVKTLSIISHECDLIQIIATIKYIIQSMFQSTGAGTDGSACLRGEQRPVLDELVPRCSLQVSADASSLL